MTLGNACALGTVLLASGALAASVHGRVVSCDGSPLPGVTIQVGSQPPVFTHVDGTFTFQLPVGKSTNVVATLSGAGTLEESVTACSEHGTEVEFTLPFHVIDDCIPLGATQLPRRGRLAGTIEDLVAKPLAGARVRVLHVSSRVVAAVARVGRNGQFRTRPIDNGAYELEVTAPGHRTKVLAVWVSSCGVPCEGRLRLRLARDCTFNSSASPSNSRAAPDVDPRRGYRKSYHSFRAGPRR